MSEYNDITTEFAEGRAREILRRRSEIEIGSQVDLPIFYRYVVLDVIFDPRIIDDTKLSYWENDLGVSNIEHAKVAPRNSIIAKRIVTNSSTHSEQTVVLYPFMPSNMALPCKAGEHVWVIYEDPQGTKNDLGYWLWRIVGPEFTEDVNHSHPHRAGDPSFSTSIKEQFEGNNEAIYEFRNGSVGQLDGERYTIPETATIPNGDEDAYRKIMTESDAGKISPKEAIPRYRKRPDEHVLEGSNNTLIVLGRERSGPVADYVVDEQKGLTPDENVENANNINRGQLDIVVGRGQNPSTGGERVDTEVGQEIGKSQTELVEDEGDPDYKNDRSRILISQRTNIDEKFELDSFNSGFAGGSINGSAGDKSDISSSEDGEGAIVIKTDKIRLIARQDVEILVTGFEPNSDGDGIVSVEDTSKWCAIVMKTNGDMVLRPAEQGYLKLGGDDADKGLLCTDTPVAATNGKVPPIATPPIMTSMGGTLINGSPGFGMLATKILVKGDK